MYSGLEIFGATATSISMGLANQGDASQIGLQLVEKDGDSFTSGTIGHPYEISYGDMTIRGILQSQFKDDSTQGVNIYTMRFESPMKLLDGVQVILSDYRRSISGVPNVFNVYGYWEDTFGYGGSYINDIGMLWETEHFDVTYSSSGTESGRTSNGMFGIKPGIENLQTGSNTIFGNAIQYRGHTYVVNFSGLPEATADWRFGGANGSASLTQIINDFCMDHGHDWFPELTSINGTGPHEITIRTVDRRTPRMDGQIAAYAATKSGYVSIQVGQEANYDYTNLFMIGGNQEELWQQGGANTISHFWGFDSNGVPLQGSILTPGDSDSYTVTINAREVADILGGPTYEVSIAELRCALANQDIWAGFILQNRLALATSIGAFSTSSTVDDVVYNGRFPHDFITQGPTFANRVGVANFNANFNSNFNRLYQFVLNYAQEWYGKRFIVKTPVSISFKIEPDTGRIIYDWEPIDSAFQENGSQPLGLSLIYEELFQDGNYRWKPFVRFADSSLIDPTTLKHSSVVVENNQMFVPCRIMSEHGIFFLGADSCVAIELENPAYYYPDDFLGGTNIIKNQFALINNDWATYKTDEPLRYGPRAAIPEQAALPMRSNYESYGPWFTSGEAGHTVFERVDGLVPWNYGGSFYMNQAAQAYMDDFVRKSQVEENGSIEYEGLPDRKIGDEIMAGGSIITDVQINISTSQVTTSYQLKNHTQRKAAFGKMRAERLMRIGQNQLRWGKNLIASTRNHLKNLEAAGFGTSNGRYEWNDRVSRMVRQQTPVGCLVSHVVEHTGIANHYETLLTSQTFSESVQNCAASGISYNTACVSMDGVFAPLSIDTEYSGIISKYAQRAEGFSSGNMSHNDNIKRFAGSEWYLWGDSYSGLHGEKNSIISSSAAERARIVGMKGPLDLVGYGYDIWGTPAPNASGSDGSSKFHFYPQYRSDAYPTGYLNRNDLWCAGPVDLRWDPVRAVWCVPSKRNGILDGNIAPGEMGVLALLRGREVTQMRLDVRNPTFQTTLESGFYATAYWDDWAGEWTIDNVECQVAEIDIPAVDVAILSGNEY